MIEALLAGLSPASAARVAGVHRSTVSRWISQGGEFHRLLRQEQGKRLRDTKREARSIAAEAANVVARAIRCGDVRAAITVLRALGVFEAPGEFASPTAVNVEADPAQTLE